MNLNETLWDDIIARSHLERARKSEGTNVISYESRATEDTPFGLLKWYLHPRLTAPSSRALYFCELTIPEGCRSGKVRHQGGIASLVVEGIGCTEFDGTSHEWSGLDVIALPVRPEGVIFRHVNTGPGPVRMVIAWPNLDSALGPEMGVAFEVIENATGYRKISAKQRSERAN